MKDEFLGKVGYMRNLELQYPENWKKKKISKMSRCCLIIKQNNDRIRRLIATGTISGTQVSYQENAGIIRGLKNPCLPVHSRSVYRNIVVCMICLFG